MVRCNGWRGSLRDGLQGVQLHGYMRGEKKVNVLRCNGWDGWLEVGGGGYMLVSILRIRICF